MDKAQAAEFLGVGLRTLERYMEKGKIGYRYEKREGSTRDVVVFDLEELERLKVELNNPTYKPAVENQSRQDSPKENETTAIQLLESIEGVARFGEFIITTPETFVSIIEQLATTKQTTPTKNNNFVPVTEKKLLSLKEAQALTGLSRQSLRVGINEGRLKAKIIGRGWKIKAKDLDSYVEALF